MISCMNKLRDIGKYRLITNGDFDLCEADVFLLDSLVLIDIRNFYFDGLNPNSASGLHQLLVTMSPNKQVRPDVVFGFALAETCFRQEGFDRLRCRRIYRAVQTVVNWNQEKIDKAFDSRHPPVKRDKQWEKGKVSIPSPSMLGMDDGDPRSFIMPAYGALLHLLKLVQGSNRRNGVEKFQEHCEWVREELGCVSAYARVIAAALLLGDEASKGKARSLLKVDHKRKSLGQKAWNAAWDAWFIQALDGYRLGMLVPPARLEHQSNYVGANAVLVTAKDQVWLDSITDFSVAFSPSAQKEISYPLICSTVTMRNQEAEKCLEEELRRDKLSFPEHIRNGDLIGKMSRAINNLENELNLPVRSFDVD